MEAEKKQGKRKSNIDFKRVGMQMGIAFAGGALHALGALLISRLANGGHKQSYDTSSNITPIKKIG